MNGLLRGHAFFQDDVTVFGGFSGHDYGKGTLCTVIEGKAVDPLGGGGLRQVFFNDGAVGIFYGRVERIAFNGGHHEEGRGHVAVEFEERENGIEQVGDAQAVGADDVVVEGFAGEVGVGQDDLVAVAHAGEGGEEFRGEEGGDAFEHDFQRLGGRRVRPGGRRRCWQ